MLLTFLLMLPLVAGFLCLIMPSAWAKGITYVGLILNLLVLAKVGQEIIGVNSSSWLLEFHIPWIPSWFISFHLGLDHLAFWLILLAEILSFCAVFVSIKKSSAYFACLNWAFFGVMGLFLSVDTLLFFVFWELTLLPIYWVLLAHGESLKISQSLRFIVFTQVSGLFLLMAVLGLSFAASNSVLTFDYLELSKNNISPEVQTWILLLFLVAFLIKLPAVPFHGWLPSLMSEGPSAVIMQAILVKTSIFGLLRFSWPMLPKASENLAPVIMIIGLISLLYGAILAFSQKDPRRVLAYGTLSHAGLLLMGVFIKDAQGFYGVLILLLASGLSTAGMLLIFEQRKEWRSGLFASHPKFSVALLAMALANMGLPIFGNFLGEWLILYGLFSQNVVFAIFASLGIVLSAAYGLRMFQRLCLGADSTNSFSDLKTTEVSAMFLLTVLIISLGLFPSLLLEPKQSFAQINEESLP